MCEHPTASSGLTPKDRGTTKEKSLQVWVLEIMNPEYTGIQFGRSAPS